MKTITINRAVVNNLNNWFLNYVETFKSGKREFDQNIVMKEKHTLRVVEEIISLGKKLGLKKKDLLLSEIIALLHDIGRFQQYARYGTFVDLLSEDHAALGVKIIKTKGILNNLAESRRSLILRAISYHNRAKLPENETKTCLFFTRLLRDADKLDIYKVVTDYYRRKDKKRNKAIELGLPDTSGISRAVLNALLTNQIVDAGKLKNLNDFKLLQVGWIYSVNFHPTFEEISKRKYLEMIRASLPKTEEIDRIFAHVNSYLDEKLEKTENSPAAK